MSETSTEPPVAPEPTAPSEGPGLIVPQPSGDNGPIVPLIIIAAGAYLTWFAIHYWRSQDVVWPSDPIKAVLQGNPLPSSTPATSAGVQLLAYETSLAASPAGAAPTGTGSGGSPGGSGGGGPSPQPGPGGTFTNAALQNLWKLAGGAADKAAVAACIAIHESSGNPRATSSNPDGGTNVGLWQLDTPGGKGAGFSIAQLMSPLTNARVAIKGSSNGTDWSAWATAPLCGV